MTGEAANGPGLLAGYRVLDMTDHRGLLAGHVLARLGADVIQVEPRGGSPTRRLPPATGGTSWLWTAYGAGKRSVTCDLDSETGREIFARLSATTDFLIESEDVGEMDRRKLGWPWLRSVNPGGIHISITGFGSDGPKATYVESDLIVWAAGGPLFANRDGASPPLRISVPQTYLHAAMDAAGGAMVALFARHASGFGQHVDISAQQSVAQASLSSILASAVGDDDFSVFDMPLKRKKTLDLSGSGARTRRSKWHTADGLVELHLAMGPAGWSTNNLFAWMRDEGALPVHLAGWDWKLVPQQIEEGKIDDADLENMREVVAAFLAPRTKQEIHEQGMARRITVAPIATTRDLLDSAHFRDRKIFESVATPQGDIELPSRFAATQGLVPLKRAPHIGEHNLEVFGDLGLDGVALRKLVREGII